MQVEYATDLGFRSAATLGPLYEQLTWQSVLRGGCGLVMEKAGGPVAIWLSFNRMSSLSAVTAFPAA